MGKGEFRSILKSTSLIGGASVVTILVGMVRTKFVAILLGPTGVGLLGMYMQLTALVTVVTGLGIGSSGVRQVAVAVGSGDDDAIARTVITLRRAAWLTGGLGLLVMVTLSKHISRITFGSADFAPEIAVLGITLLAGALAAGRQSVINGTRRIADLARNSVLGAVNGTLIAIPCFYFWGKDGIVPSLVLSALAAAGTAWWFARRVPVKRIALPIRDSFSEGRQLLLLGVSFMGAGLVSNLSEYLIRSLLVRQFGLGDVGIYQAAFNLSGILVGFVLGAMGADYYPRLAGIVGDNQGVRRMVNDQLQVSVLLALPGLAAMMVFAPPIVRLFYAASFAAAVPILRWFILGTLGRVFAWPMGFLMLAKGNGKIFFVTEFLAGALHLGAVALFSRIWGLPGAGIAFMALYLVYTALLLVVMKKLVGATWNRETTRLVVAASATMALLMVNCTVNGNGTTAWLINVMVFVSVTWGCVRQLSRQSGITAQAVLAKLPFARRQQAS